MSRESDNYYLNGQLWDGYDYENQAWVKDGKYLRCGHPESMNCNCYGKLHEGEETQQKSYLGDNIDLTLPKGAIFSLDGKYRYILWRAWSPSKPVLAYIGLNPSKAGLIIGAVITVCITRLACILFNFSGNKEKKDGK